MAPTESKQMGAAAVSGQNMKNVIKQRKYKREKCPDRRGDITFASLPRIKKIMQKNAEVGRIAMAVPVIISRALEIFLKCLLTKTCTITQSKLSAVVSVAHIGNTGDGGRKLMSKVMLLFRKQCIESEKLFDFLKDPVDRATSMESKKDNRGVSVWPLYRPGRREASVKKPVDEMAPRPRSDSLDNDNSSSEPELYICC